jgi:RHS repeat-associated protein
VYGELRNVVGEKAACPFRWPGQYEDEETGLYYNRFRYYDRDAGEYVSQDPIGLLGGLQTHAYVRSPLAAIDPSGLSSCKTPAEEAAGWQGKGDYPGVDKWRNIVLKKGTILHGGVPGQTAFYTNERSLSRFGGTRNEMGNALQVKPHKEFGYRPQMQTYVVKEDTPAAIALTRANSKLGDGGATQFYVPNFANSVQPIGSPVDLPAGS